MDTNLQYLRKCTLLVATASNEALDLSELRIKFATKNSDNQTPNSASIRVYNLAEETAKRIKKEFTAVVLQAGYEGNYGVIFQGNIKQVILGRESSTDTFIDISAGDGDRAYNFAIVNTTLAAGSTQENQIQSALTPMQSKGVSAGVITNTKTEKLPRGKVMYGNSSEYLRQSAQTTNSSWSIQNGKVNFISATQYLPGERVILTSKSGMIGTPEQTVQGVNVKCLLNPTLKVSGQVELDNSTIAEYKIDFTQPGSPANTPPPLTADGVYYLLVIEHIGDTRGTDWYSNLICIAIDITTNPLNSVQTGLGG